MCPQPLLFSHIPGDCSRFQNTSGSQGTLLQHDLCQLDIPLKYDAGIIKWLHCSTYFSPSGEEWPSCLHTTAAACTLNPFQQTLPYVSS